jgi:hypothetical protein
MKTSLVLSASLLLTSTAAVANPMMTVQELRGQALAGPHVKLTFTFNYSPDPVSATTHGTSHSPWVSAGSTSRDTGSGVKPLPILEMCDCHVPTGIPLDYKLVYASGFSSSTSVQVSVPTSPSGVDCTTACQLADAAAADAGGLDAPVATGGAIGTGGATGSGGTDGTGGATSSGGADGTGGATGSGGAIGTGGATGSGGAPGTGGATSSGGAIGTGGATGSGGAIGTGGAQDPIPPAKTKGGGCAFVATRTSPALLYLALLALVITARRRSP